MLCGAWWRGAENLIKRLHSREGVCYVSDRRPGWAWATVVKGLENGKGVSEVGRGGVEAHGGEVRADRGMPVCAKRAALWGENGAWEDDPGGGAAQRGGGL